MARWGPGPVCDRSHSWSVRTGTDASLAREQTAAVKRGEHKPAAGGTGNPPRWSLRAGETTVPVGPGPGGPGRPDRGGQERMAPSSPAADRGAPGVGQPAN